MNKEFSRRDFLKAAAAGAGALVVGDVGVEAVDAAPPEPDSMEALRKLQTRYAEAVWSHEPLSTVTLPVNPELGVAEKDVHNRTVMIIDPRDGTYKAGADKAKAYGQAQGWGDVLAKKGEWFYPMMIEDGTYKLGPETWAYAVQVVQADDLSVYQKPKVAGQIWARLPKDVNYGELTLALAVNPNYVADKTGGDANITPAVIIRGNTNAPVEAVYRLANGTTTGALGRLETETGNVILQLQPSGSVGDKRSIAVVRFPVWSPTGDQTEIGFELGSDIKAGTLHNPRLNRITPAMAQTF